MTIQIFFHKLIGTRGRPRITSVHCKKILYKHSNKTLEKSNNKEGSVEDSSGEFFGQQWDAKSTIMTF